jgi:hypothetical protein
MATTEQRAAGEPNSEATPLELWAMGELHDDTGSPGPGLTLGAMTGILVALAAFFVAFGPVA